ncbi:ABC transporter permease [Paramicrobacterium fandaimingii]|uniref:ABC transporter permease n=1 Tax=Paramicrobacterium fandaimingii TaxID=2708079 RepID=UPI0014222225|nr:ABC transporter permease [Microbacterium fandaimingii]
MGSVILRRVLIAIPVVFGITVLLFVTLRVLPGDPTEALLAEVPVTTEVRQQLTEQLGLNQPLLVQYWNFIWHALQGDLGRSFTTGQGVTDMILSQLPATIRLTIAGVILTAVFGIGFGVLAAAFRDTWVDSTIRIFSLLGTGMPVFWTGSLLLLVFSFQFHIFPSTGNSGLSHLVLPAIALGFLSAGLLTRLVRNSMVELFGESFVLALHAKGLSPRVVTVRHVLRNALIPVVTVIGLQVGGLLSGAVISEIVFSRQGLGRLLVTGINGQDFPVVQGTVLVIALIYVGVNIVVDVSYAYIDPRVRTAIAQS